MTAPRVGASPTGQTHYLDDEGGPLCNVRVSDEMIPLKRQIFFTGVVEPTCQRCRTKYAKPCPFCGHEPRFWPPDETGDPGHISCPHCGTTGPDMDGHYTKEWKDIYGGKHSTEMTRHLENRLQVFNAWNRRTTS